MLIYFARDMQLFVNKGNIICLTGRPKESEQGLTWRVLNTIIVFLDIIHRLDFIYRFVTMLY
jgi:hypothetical protein